MGPDEALKAAQADLRESEAKYRALFEQYRLLFTHNPNPMWIYDVSSLQILAVNAAAVAHYGYRDEEFLRLTIRDLVPEEDRSRVESTVSQIAGVKARTVWRHNRKDGSSIDVELLSDDVPFEGHRARLVLATDITERREVERRIAEQAALLEQANDVIMVRDLDHRILYWNRSAERVFGWTAAEAIGQVASDLLAVDVKAYELATAIACERGEWSGELQKRGKDGRIVTIASRWTLLRDEAGQPTSILLIDTDITERKRIQAHALRAQRMESIGTLAGGIAHDLNNILAPIMMSVELLRDDIKTDEGQALLETLTLSAKRGAALVKQVLSFSRGLVGERIALDLRPLVREIARVIAETFPKSIRLQLSETGGLWAVNGDATQLHQVILNLCVNARDAMPRGGRLSIALTNEMLDETYTGMSLDAHPGPYVTIEVADEGTGIPPDLRDRIFEPFFTTKEVGKGTGLGLSTSASIIKAHGGFINVYSELGKGSRFRIYLPAISETEATTTPLEREALPPRGSGELILVVEDEDRVREVVHRTLERWGYEVLTAANGAEALGVYATHRDRIAVVLTDMAMPILDGPGLIVALRTINPQVCIIGSSGLEENEGVTKAIGAGLERFVPKPYTGNALLHALARVLGR